MLLDFSLFNLDDGISSHDQPHIVEIRDPTSDPILELLWDNDSFTQQLTRGDDSLMDQNSEIIGIPAEDSEYWQRQQADDTCALVAAAGVIRSMTGEYVSEEEIVREATARGWYNGNGTSPDDFGKILSVYDVDYHVKMNATTADIIRELVYGHKVMVAVDGGEIWNGQSPGEIIEDLLAEMFGFQAADHAIWITGVDLSDPSDIKVIMNDSGVDDGAGKSISLSLFRDAWEDSGFRYVATDEAPSNLDQIVTGFDAETGTFPDIIAYFENYSPGFLDDSPTYDGIGIAATYDNLMANDPHLGGTLGMTEVKIVRALLELIEQTITKLLDLLKAIDNALPELVQEFKDNCRTMHFSRALRIFLRDFPEEVKEHFEKIRDDREADQERFRPDNSFYDPDQRCADALTAIEAGQLGIPMAATDVVAAAVGQQGIVVIDTGEEAAQIAYLHVDTEDPANPQVIINSNGFDQFYYTVDEFIDAWTGANFCCIGMDGMTQDVP